MKAFLGDKEVKKKYLARVIAHAKADEIVKGQYWENGKGCAVGCTIHSNDHSAYERELGVPEWLARLEDQLFEKMPLKEAKKWPKQFLEAINIGADLEQVKLPFVVFILKSSIKSMKAAKFDVKKFPRVLLAQRHEVTIKKMIRCYKLGLPLDSATYPASSATDLMYSIAFSAADSASSAADSASSATDLAYSVASSAADSAYSAAFSAAYLKFSKKLLQLLRACKSPKTNKKGKK